MVEDAFYIRRMWSFSRALDLGLVDDEIEKGLQLTLGERHGERVAYIAMRLGRCLGLSKKDLVQVTVAGLLHDIRALGCFREYHGFGKTLLGGSVSGRAFSIGSHSCICD